MVQWVTRVRFHAIYRLKLPTSASTLPPPEETEASSAAPCETTTVCHYRRSLLRLRPSRRAVRNPERPPRHQHPHVERSTTNTITNNNVPRPPALAPVRTTRVVVVSAAAAVAMADTRCPTVYSNTHAHLRGAAPRPAQVPLRLRRPQLLLLSAHVPSSVRESPLGVLTSSLGRLACKGRRSAGTVPAPMPTPTPTPKRAHATSNSSNSSNSIRH